MLLSSLSQAKIEPYSHADAVRRSAQIQYRLSPTAVAVVALTGVFAALQLYGLTTAQASRDEAFTWRLIQYPLIEQVERTSLDVHPPLYYMFVAVWSALAGNSMAALRGFSVIAVFAAIAVTAIGVQATLDFLGKGMTGGVKRNCALFTFAFLAIHVTELESGRNARMYALGMLLASLSAWVLLKALFSATAQLRWWVAYGVTISAFAYTHYYAFFTIFAQAVYVAPIILLRVRHEEGRWRRDGVRFLLALVIAGASYAPWIPVVIRQTAEVGEGFWIPRPKWSDVGEILFFWGTGYRSLSTWDWWIFAIGFVLLVSVALVRLFPAASYWLLQASVPWICAIFISRAGGTPVFWPHYFAFAHVAFGALGGVIVASMPGRILRFAAGWFLLAGIVFGMWKHVCGRFSDEPAIANALQFISEQFEEGDVILAPWFGEVNAIRYYACQAHMPGVDVRALGIAPAAKGHTIHIASLNHSDRLDRNVLERSRKLRVWEIGMDESSVLEELSSYVFTRRFIRDGDVRDCTVRLYVKRNGEWLGDTYAR